MSDSGERANSYPEQILLPQEKWWKSRYEYLEKRGYRLRPRYEPNWSPSWLEPGNLRLLCEDNYASKYRKAIDALQLSSGKRIVLKSVKKSSEEKNIATFLYSVEFRSDPRNHCVHILDTFEDEMDSDIEFIVMPLLQAFNSPSFDSVEEALDFVKQLLEVTIFMHEKGVAHRDLCTLNIMYNADKVYPEGFHPAARFLASDAGKLAHFISRTAAGGVKYYVTDFGLSAKFEDSDERQVLGLSCQDKTVPELSDTKPYDPFQVDIYTLGNVFKEDLTDIYTNMKIIKPLIWAMTEDDPASRPTARSALTLFDQIEKKQSIRTMKWKLKKKESNIMVRMYRDVKSLRPVASAYVNWLLGARGKS